MKLLILILMIASTSAFATVNPSDTVVYQASTCPSIDRAKVLSQLDAEDLVKDAHLVPEIVDNEKVVGLRFASLRPCGLFEAIGFQQDDLLLEVEGTPTNSPVGGMMFFSYVRGEAPFSVKIVRNGQTLELSIK